MIRLSRNSLIWGMTATALAGPMLYPHPRQTNPLELVTGAVGPSRLVPPPDGTAANGEPDLSQDMPPRPPKEAETASEPQPDAVDLAAIYYYARQKQEDRVSAEAARLRIRFPDFEMPQDLYAAGKEDTVDETPLWALYENDDFVGIDKAAAALRDAHPGWQPSADFTGKLARRKLRVSLTTAFREKDWTGLVSAGTSVDPVTEKDADLLWMLIDAYREAAMPDALAAVYKGMLFRPRQARLPDPVLVTTLQKAMQDFDVEEIRGVVSLLWPDPSGVAALKPMQDDFIRADIADFNRRSDREQPVKAQDIQRLRDLVAARGDVADMSLLGWYFLKSKLPGDAEPHFRRALEEKPSAELVKGLYLALAQQDRFEDAYTLATSHIAELQGDPQFLLNALALRFARPDPGMIDEKTITAFTATIMQEKSADHAEILAWYAYNAGQFAAAEAWFVQSWNWEEEPNRLKGIALSFLREGKKREFAALHARFGDLYPDMWAEIMSARPPAARPAQAALVAAPAGSETQQIVFGAPDEAPVLQAPVLQAASYEAQPAPATPAATAVGLRPSSRTAAEKGPRNGYLAAFRNREYARCLEQLDGHGQRGALAPDAELIRGWCFLGLSRIADASASFARAMKGTGQVQRDAAYGYALAALRAKMTDKADAVVDAYTLDPPKEKEVRVEIYWQRARSAFDHGDYQATLDALNARLKLVPEPTDLSALRAWAHFKLGHSEQARAIFEKLNAQISDPDLMQGLAAMDRKSR